MKHLTAYHMIGFNDQLSKEAGLASGAVDLGRRALSRIARLGGARTAAGLNISGHLLQHPIGARMAVGAGVGAAGGALTGEEGTRGSRALKGALLGAGVGGGAYLASKQGREALRHFGARQKYFLTGKGVDAQKAHEIGILRKPSPEAFKNPTTGKVNTKALEQANKAYADDLAAYESGYLSAPGVLHGLLTSPTDLIRSGWRRSGTLGKAFTGLGAIETGRQALTPTEPGGPGRAERVLRSAGQTAGWLVAPHAMLPGIAAGAGLGAAGGGVGKLIDYGAGRVANKGRAPEASPYDY